MHPEPIEPEYIALAILTAAFVLFLYGMSHL